MKEQMIKRIIMEAGNDANKKNICMQMTFHGYAEDEIISTIFEAEKFWEDVKERLFLKDVSEKKKRVANATAISCDFTESLQSGNVNVEDIFDQMRMILKNQLENSSNSIRESFSE